MLTRGIPIEQIIILIPVLLFSLCFHEFSHAYAAFKLGDNTSERLGRLNLSPLSHLDPWGTLMLLFVGFGWAKPVPVNPFNLKNPKKDLMIIAAAGPLSNLFLAFMLFYNESFNTRINMYQKEGTGGGEPGGALGGGHSFVGGT